MKDYFYFYKGWHKKSNGTQSRPFSEWSLVRICAKRSDVLQIKEGFIILDLMKRKYNRICKPKHWHLYERER